MGKAEEFKERKTYDVPHSNLSHKGPIHADAREDRNFSTSLHEAENGLMLFTTKTCPNCRIAKAALDKSGLSYQVVDAEENPDLCRKFNIQQAPTLVSITDGVATVITNASQIRSFAESAV